MTPALLIIVFIVVANAARRRLELPADPWTVMVGAGIAAAGYIVLALVGEPLLDGLDISAPNARIAAGFVVVVAAIVDLVRRPDPDGPSLGGRGAALVPVAFPILLRPDLGALALSGGADPGIGWAALATIVGAVSIVAAHRYLPVRAAAIGGRLLGVCAVGLGIVTILDGVFAV